MLTEEGRNLQSVVDAAAGESDRARALHGGVSRQESDLAAAMEGVGALFSLLHSALEDESFTKSPEAAVEAQTALEKEVLRDGDGSGGAIRSRRRRGSLLSVAARVRATSHRNRTPDEKRWVALDAVLNPRLYHHVTLAEAEEMRWDALYYAKLDREDVLRVLSLPPQVQLALPFLHTPNEVAAHELLARYSHGINADHFARLDKGSQDVGRGGMPTAFPSSASIGEASAAVAGAGGIMTADRVAAQEGATSCAGEDTVVGATRRVLACMQRAAHAKLKLFTEREDDEAVWCVLDKKLRPDLYRDSDEAAADRSEELHRETDAREDARHTWLATPSDTSNGGGKTEVTEMAGTGSGTTVASVVRQKCKASKADEFAAEKKTVKDREAIVVEISFFFTVDDIKAIASAAAGGSLGGVELGRDVELDKTAATGGEESARAHEGSRGPTPTSAGANDGETEASTLATATGEAERDAGGSSQQHYDRTSTSDGDEGDDNASAKVEGSNHQQNEERRRLVETVKRVLPRFLVAEEETPLGRDMTRSLAMLQEVTLRLEKGQRNVFSGLNPQSALTMVRSRWQPSTTVPSTAEERSAAPAGSPAAEERGEAERAAVGETAADSKGREETVSIETAVTAPSQGAAGAASSAAVGEIKANSAGTKQRPVGETKSASESGSRIDKEDRGDRESMASRGGGSMMSATPRRLDKVFGSWEEIHPAALGISSQESYLEMGGQEAHPASFRGSASSKGASS